MSRKNPKAPRGPSFTVKGYMSPSMCKRFKTNNVGTWNDISCSARSKQSWIKRATEAVKTMRQLTVGAPTDRLPSNIRNAILFFSVPYTPDQSRRLQSGGETGEVVS